MKRKAILSLIVVICMTFALAVPAFAQEATDPQGSAYNGDNPSEGETTLRSTNDGDTWSTTGDDSNQNNQTDLADGNKADIFVWAKIVSVGEDDIIYCIDIEWGNMKFVFGINNGVWNPDERTYSAGTGEGEWWVSCPATAEQYLDGENNRVTVRNRSNADVEAGFTFTFDGDGENNKFNASDSDDRVVGNFFNIGMDNVDTIAGGVITGDPGSSERAEAIITAIESAREENNTAANGYAIDASKILTDNGSSVQTQVNAFDTDEHGFSLLRQDETRLIIAADNEDLLGIADLDAFPFLDVFFAFSGTPDVDSTLTSAPFTKVGIITVTITPQDTP